MDTGKPGYVFTGGGEDLEEFSKSLCKGEVIARKGLFILGALKTSIRKAFPRSQHV